MPVQKFVSKPVTIEALQLSRENRGEVLRWLGETNYQDRKFDPVNVLILNEHGPVLAEPGDWIIRGTRGEFYPCKDSTFREKYAPVGSSATGGSNAQR